MDHAMSEELEGMITEELKATLAEAIRAIDLMCPDLSETAAIERAELEGEDEDEVLEILAEAGAQEP